MFGKKKKKKWLINASQELIHMSRAAAHGALATDGLMADGCTSLHDTTIETVEYEEYSLKLILSRDIPEHTRLAIWVKIPFFFPPLLVSTNLSLNSVTKPWATPPVITKTID